MTSHDVLIVGTRCAGASLAMLLARGGNKVLAVRMTGDRKVCPNCDSREKSFDADFSRTLADRGTAPLISR